MILIDWHKDQQNENPLLFFKLMSIDVNRFADAAKDNKIEMRFSHSDCKSSRIIDSCRQLRLFGI